ncbi:MAG: glycosyltransferase family 4 protein [Bryobacteraceae bacterium]
MSRSSSPAHILITVRELGIGGTERQACLVARLLDPKLFRVSVGCFIPQGLRRAELDAAGLNVVEFPNRSFLSPRFPLVAARARRWTEKENVALVHCFDYPTAVFFAAALSPSKKLPLLTSLRNYRALTPQPYRFLLQQAERWADRIVVNSAGVRDELVEREGIEPSRLHLLHNAVNPAEFPPPPDLSNRVRPPQLEGASLVVGCVCGIREEKDLPTLIRAVHQVLPEIPGIRLVLVGSGPAEPEIEALRRELKLENVCVLVPQTTNTTPWYQATDIFVLPSISEASSNALLEAMSSECAVIASAIGGNREIVQSGVNGLLFPARDVTALANALRKFTADASYRRALAAAGRESVEANFSPAAAARNLTALYQDLIAGNRKR